MKTRGCLSKCLINNISLMKKEEKQKHHSISTRSLYKYQLQYTNEILKETLELHSHLLSTAATARGGPSPPQHTTHSKVTRTQRHSLSPPSKKLKVSPSAIQIYEQIEHQKMRKGKRQEGGWDCISKDAFLNSQIYSQQDSSSQVQRRQHSRTLLNRDGDQSHPRIISSNKKDLRRQRRGLADISLKVKNIVARMGKMTFKEVADQVLKQSEEDLPHSPQDREKQTKNIRRRVYDALNVLVAVGILDKRDRCAVHTQLTNIRGKKLSENYEIVVQRRRELSKEKKSLEAKTSNLILLQKNLLTLKSFHDRNKSLLGKGESLNVKKEAIKLFFPLIFLLPPKISQKIRVQIQIDSHCSENLKKYLIEGTDYILTDLDTLKYIGLPSCSPPIESAHHPTHNQSPNEDIYLSDQCADSKKIVFGLHDSELRRKPVKSTGNLKHYGPPPIPQQVLSSDIGYRLKQQPEGLKRKTKKVQFKKGKAEEPWWPMTQTEGSLLKRMSRLDYLSGWSSKKPILNLCQEKLITKLQQKIAHGNRNTCQL